VLQTSALTGIYHRARTSLAQVGTELGTQPQADRRRLFSIGCPGVIGRKGCANRST
jgi:hypothetical protein